MAEIPSHILNLNDTDLRAELRKVGITPAPLTPTTRRIYKKKLAKSLGVLAASNEQANQQVKINLNEKLKNSLDADENKPPTSQLRAEPANVTYFGVFASSCGDETLVFTQREALHSFLKKNKTVNFKQFTNKEDAEEYSRNGSRKQSKSNNMEVTVSNESNSVQKDTLFGTPKQEELNEFMREITKGNWERCKEMIWDNPKFLISSADGPVILKASVRYNAVHVAVKENQAHVCSELLATILNPEFYSLMFSDDSDSSVAQARMQHLLDLYLNTPDKGMYETPLHLACKFGYVDVVKELLSYPICSKTALNKFQDTPGDVTCSRCNNPTAKDKITQMLQDQYFVPLLRYEDNSRQPIIASPVVLNKQINEDSLNVSKAMELVNASHASSEDHILSPDLTISALAGPMSKLQAENLHKKWSTPRKSNLKGDIANIRRMDPEKGDEIIGRKLALNDGVDWSEYWQFLDEFVDFSTESGLRKLEDYLTNRNAEECCISNMFSSLQLSDRKINPPNQKQNYFSTPQYKKTLSQHSNSSPLPNPFAVKKDFMNNLQRTPTTTTNNDKENHKPLSGIPKPEFCNTPKSIKESSAMYREQISTSSDSSIDDSLLNCSTSSNVFEDKYNNFILGSFPQKVDKNVWNAINKTKVDEKSYPNVFKWYNALSECTLNISFRPGTPSLNMQRYFSTTPQSPGVKLKKFFTPESKKLFN